MYIIKEREILNFINEEECDWTMTQESKLVGDTIYVSCCDELVDVNAVKKCDHPDCDTYACDTHKDDFPLIATNMITGETKYFCCDGCFFGDVICGDTDWEVVPN